MTDDPSGYPPGPAGNPGEGRYLPEMPVVGPPTVPPPVTPQPPGTPPPGSIRAGGADNWPWWYALLAFIGGFVVSQIGVLVVGGVWIAVSGGDFDALTDDPSFTLVASAVSELLFIASALWVAKLSGSVSLRDFGLVRAPFKSTFWRAVGVMVGYFILLGIYSQLVHLAPDDAPEKLGAQTGTLGMLFFAIMVAVLAPIAEEFFFRGMIYRALKNGVGIAAAAIISGLLFGAMHIDSTSTDRLLQVVPLAILGISFALLYQWTGTLYATIALHATNNAIAVAAYADKHNSDFGMALAVVIWLLMMVFCIFGCRLTDRGTPSGFPGNDGGGVGYALPR